MLFFVLLELNCLQIVYFATVVNLLALDCAVFMCLGLISFKIQTVYNDDRLTAFDPGQPG